MKLGWKVPLGIDGVHRALIDAGHAIDAFLRVDDQLLGQLIKAGYWANHDAVGEFAGYAFVGHDVRHKSLSGSVR